jgi:Protein of unknown function (DUF3223)
MPYTVAEVVFPTKNALTERARLALAGTPVGQPVSEMDTVFLLALFQYHDEWDKKSAGGIREITTQTTIHGTRCFVLRKHDGNEIDISFPHAIRLIPSVRTVDLQPQALRDFRSAARTAIQEQIFVYRDQALLQLQTCKLTNEILSQSNAAVDHMAPNTFDELIFLFCKQKRINPLEVLVGSIAGVVATFEDKDLLRDWKTFHQTRANLRLISRVANLKLPKQRVAWTELWS